MDTLVLTGQLLLSLSILVALHEFGHFIAARIFKTRVEKFYIFFDFLFPFPNLMNFSLFKFKKGDTEFGLGWFPLGGYVKISGMVDESMDKEQMAKPPEPWEFRSKPAWQRLIIMLGGIIVNLILAVVIYWFVLFTWGDKYLPNENLSDGVWVTDSMAMDMGVQNGDKFVTVGGEPVERFNEIVLFMLEGGDMVVERNGAQETLPIPENFIEQLVDKNGKTQLFYPRMPFIIASIPDSSHNAGAGLLEKDKVVAIGGQPILYFDEAQDVLKEYKNRDISIKVERDGAMQEVPVHISDDAKIGVAPAFLSLAEMDQLGVYTLNVQEYGFFEALPAGFNMAVERMGAYLAQLKLILNPSTGAYKGLGGFGTIAKLFPTTWNWEAFWRTTAFISLILAFINFVPIPMLDGGYVLFTLAEMVTRRKIPDKFIEYANLVGFVLILFLIVYANGNDIFRAFKN